MALIIADRVKETTTTPGTGTVTLDGSAIGGFQTFSEAIGDSNTTYYCIQNGSNFEIGLGTYSSSGNTLSRDTVFQSSNSDSKINISGVGVVFCVVPADKLVYKDGEDSLVYPKPFVFKRSDDGDYWQALSTNYTNRVASFYIQQGADPTWKIGLKTTTSEIIAPYYAYISGKDGFIELRGNSNSTLSIGDENAQGLQVNHQLKNIIDIRKNGGQIAIQNLDLNSDETTTAKNNSVAYTVFSVESTALHASDLQTWNVATDEKASLNQYGDFETLGNIISPSGRFDAVRFSDASVQTSAGLPLVSGTLIDQNAADIVTQSGYFQNYIDGLDHSATDVSGWAESYIDEISGVLQPQINANKSDILTVSGLIGDADFLPGSSGGLIDQNTSDIITVSGLLSVGGLPSTSGSLIDQNTSDIATVSGLLTPSGESFDFAGNLLTYNNSDGGSFTADLSSLSTFDTSGVSLAYSAGTLTYTNNAGGSFDVDISSISGDVYALIVDGAPTTLDTLNEIAAALNDDENIANTLTSLISTTSGNLQTQITSNDGDITQLNSDIITVSGLLYDDTAISGYFESRVDSADSNITANSGYFESRVDSADSNITANSGYFESRVDQLDSDLSYVSGVAVYASGHTLQTVTDNGASTTNALTITNNNIIASSGLFDSLDMTPLAQANYPAHQEGVVFYDSENHTLSLYNDEADVTLQLGQEEFLRVRNNTGATIPNGAAVLINGSHGNAAPTISGAIATSEANSQIVGLTTHSIETDSFGYVTTYGIVRDVDTSAFSAGDEVFLSATEIGSGVAIAPTIPNYKVTIGHVIRNHANNGSILVQIGHAKLGGGDLKSETALNISGVPFVTTISDTNAGGSQTDPLFVYDSGNNQLQLASLLIEPNVATKIGQVIKSAVSQSVNLQEWQNSSENVLSHVDTSGVYTNIIGSSGTDILRVQYGDAESNQTVASNADIKGVWLDFEDGSEYTAGTVNGNALLIGTWYNTAKTIPSRIKIGATSFNVSLANSQKIDVQGTTTKFNTDVVPFTTVARDLGTTSLVWRNLYASGITVSGVELTNHIPADTTNKLYNDAGTLKFNGSAVGGGGGGGGLPYSSGDYYLEEIRANSASGLVNLNNINTISGLIPPNTFNITGGDGSNYTIDAMGLNSASDPTMYLHKGHTYIFNKTFSGHPFRVSATDGGAVYTDADSNNIEIGSSAGSVTFEVPQDAPDKLYYYCTAHPSAMKGEIYTTTDGATSGYFEARVDQNAADIITVSGLTGGGGGSYSAGSGLTLVGSEFNVYGGSGNFLNLEVEDNLNVSGVATFDQVSTFQSGVKTNINTEADATTITFDMDQSNVHMVTLGGGRTLAVSNTDIGQKFLIRLQQDSTGSRSVTWWSNIKWAEGGTEPTLTTTPNKADLFGFLVTSGTGPYFYDGFVVGKNI